MPQSINSALYRQYQLEQSRYRLFVPMLRYFGFSMLGFYLYLLFFWKGLDSKYFLLNLYALYCNSSVMILFQYYKVPTLFENLFSNDNSLVHESYSVIDASRDSIYKSFLMELYGRNYHETQMAHGMEEMKTLILSLERLEWKKIGRVYFGIFFFFSFLLFYYLFPIES